MLKMNFQFVCGTVCAYHCITDKYNELHAQNILGRIEIDDIIKPEVTRENFKKLINYRLEINSRFLLPVADIT